MDLNGRRCDVTIAFVIRFANPGPNPVHQLIMVVVAVMKAAIGFTERVGLLARSDEVSLG